MSGDMYLIFSCTHRLSWPVGVSPGACVQGSRLCLGNMQLCCFVCNHLLYKMSSVIATESYSKLECSIRQGYNEKIQISVQ